MVYFNHDVHPNDAEKCAHLDNVEFSSVTPPIELINGKAYQFDYGNTPKLIGVYANESREFRTVAGYYESLSCNNIQLLEVK